MEIKSIFLHLLISSREGLAMNSCRLNSAILHLTISVTKKNTKGQSPGRAPTMLRP